MNNCIKTLYVMSPPSIPNVIDPPHKNKKINKNHLYYILPGALIIITVFTSLYSVHHVV